MACKGALLTPQDHQLLKSYFDEYLDCIEQDDKEIELSDYETQDHPVVKKLNYNHPHLLSDFLNLIQNIETPDNPILQSPKKLMEEVKNIFETSLEPYQRIHDFVILSHLGKGSLAQVYLAHDTQLDRKVALKFQKRETLFEAKTLAALDHPNIIKVFYEFEWCEYHVLCSQYIQGQNLEDYLTQVSSETNPSNHFETIIYGFLQLTDALVHAHHQKILHLDLKPQNILVDEKRRFYLSDFNVSLKQGSSSSNPLSQSSYCKLGGTPGYMAPEQSMVFQQSGATSKTLPPRDNDSLYNLNKLNNLNLNSLNCIDQRSDIYGLGQVLNKILVTFESRFSQFDRPLKNLFYDLKRVQTKCSQPDPLQRYSSTQDLKFALESCWTCFDIQKNMQRSDGLSHFILKHPALSLIFAALLPQLFGSMINIIYNSSEIIEHLSVQHKNRFEDFLIFYNLLFFPLAIGSFFFITRRLFLQSKTERLHKESLKIPGALFWATTVGWLPGTFLFPFYILGGTTTLSNHFIHYNLYFHFGISFTMAWMISLAFSQLLSYVVIIEAYFTRTVLDENQVKRAESFIEMLPKLCSTVPLYSALLIIWTGSHDYKNLISILLLLGLVSIIFSQNIKNRLHRDLRAILKK